MSPRFAIYFVPPPNSRLATFGNAVLGYDCDRGAPVPQVPLSAIDADEMRQMTQSPAQYGFHATLKAPFRLRTGRSESDLRTALDAFCGNRRPVSIGRLVVEQMGAFFALRPAENTKSVDDLAADCLQAFDEFRAPPPVDECERRRTAGLTPRQDALLDRWGYPYVLDEFRFHLTLAGPLPEERRETWRKALREAFAALASESWEIDAVAMARQDGPKTPFRVVHRAKLAG